jgi:hypothetical protein
MVEECLEERSIIKTVESFDETFLSVIFTSQTSLRMQIQTHHEERKQPLRLEFHFFDDDDGVAYLEALCLSVGERDET